MCRLCHSAPAVEIIHAFPYQLEGKAERDAYAEAVEGQRQAIEAPHIEATTALLASIGERAVAAVVAQRRAEAAVDVVAAARPEIDAAYTALFEDVVPHFAGETFGGLKAYLPPLRKDEGDLWLEAARLYAAEHLPQIGSLATETVRDLLAAVLADGFGDGLGYDEIAGYFRERWPEVSAYQAERMVRTEGAAASGYGAVAGARATNLPMDKEWIAALDSRTRETHQAADAQTVDLDGVFTIGGYPARFPGDPRLPVGERVFCRCTVAFIVKGA